MIPWWLVLIALSGACIVIEALNIIAHANGATERDSLKTELERALADAETQRLYAYLANARHDAIFADYGRQATQYHQALTAQIAAETELAQLKSAERPKLTKAQLAEYKLDRPCIHCGGAHTFLCPLIQTITYYPAFAADQERALTEVERIERIEYVNGRFAETWPQVAEFPDEEEAA